MSELPLKESVCAVVVTYNRKCLLLECLEALFKQTYPLEAIYIIDNASTDGTPEMLKGKGVIRSILNPDNYPLEEATEVVISGMHKIHIHYFRMHENIGGAGGFYYGTRLAHEAGHKWIWLMDD